MPSTDPTKTKTRREQWVSNFNARWRRVRGAVRSELVESDRFRISPQTPDDWDQSAVRFAFESWLRSELDDEVINQTYSRNVAFGNHWTAQNVRDGYEAGLRRADQLLRRAGYDVPETSPEASLTDERHEQQIRKEYTRVYQDIQNVSQDVVSEAVREIDSALEGQRPSRREIARMVNDRVDKVGRNRSRMIAQTRTVEAANVAALERYEQANIDSVEADPEIEVQYQTAQDPRVCRECQRLQGRQFSIDDARGVLPQHPMCRCFWVPI